MKQTVEKLRPYVLGWTAYFALEQKHQESGESSTNGCAFASEPFSSSTGKRPQTIYRELKAMGATQDVAKQVPGNCHR